MCTILMLTRRGIVSAAFLGASLFTGASACTGPAALEARVQARADALSYAALGTWFNENQRADCAIEAFQSALKIDPASKTALDGLAKAQIAAGKFEAVIRRLRAAPLDENLTLDLAAAYRKTEMFDDAARVLTEGLKRYPNSDGLTAALVSLYVHQSHYAAAQAVGFSHLHLPLQSAEVCLRSALDYASLPCPSLAPSIPVSQFNWYRIRRALHLAEMIGTTRSRASFFLNRFHDLGYIDYNVSGMRINSSLVKVVLND
jgi:tetratricopeptide (TPR) repeat protein